MKLYQKATTTLSEDAGIDPKQIRFSATDEITEIEILKDGAGFTKTFPIGTHTIDLDEITQGRWLYIKPEKNITVSINGGAPITFLALKPSSLWVQMTALSITVAEATRVTVCVAGE